MTNEWRSVKLGELINSLNAGISVNSYDYKCKENEIGILKTSCISGGKFYPLENKAVIESEYNRVVLNPKKGEIIISRMNTPELVGEIGYVSENYENIFLPDRLWQTELKEGICGKWLSLVLITDKIRQQIKNVSTGTSNSMKNISKPNFLSIKLELPPFNEQEKIAEILSTWDLTIEKQEQLIEKKRKFKKGLIQKLLRGEFRFKGFKDEWKTYRVNELINQVINKNKNRQVSLVLSVNNKRGFITQEEQFEKQVASKDLTNYKIVKKGEFAYNPSRINVGSIDLLEKFDEGLLSPMYVVFKCNEKLLSEYYYYWIKTNMFLNQMNKYLSGSVRETLSFEDMGLMEIKIPSIDEQKTIVNLLHTVDGEMELLEKELGALKLQKKGLMQRLLTGEVRVKI